MASSCRKGECALRPQPAHEPGRVAKEMSPRQQAVEGKNLLVRAGRQHLPRTSRAQNAPAASSPPHGAWGASTTLLQAWHDPQGVQRPLAPRASPTLPPSPPAKGSKAINTACFAHLVARHALIADTGPGGRTCGTMHPP
jgi:hypothetical protein